MPFQETASSASALMTTATDLFAPIETRFSMLYWKTSTFVAIHFSPLKRPCMMLQRLPKTQDCTRSAELGRQAHFTPISSPPHAEYNSIAATHFPLNSSITLSPVTQQETLSIAKFSLLLAPHSPAIPPMRIRSSWQAQTPGFDLSILRMLLMDHSMWSTCIAR